MTTREIRIEMAKVMGWKQETFICGIDDSTITLWVDPKGNRCLNPDPLPPLTKDALSPVIEGMSEEEIQSYVTWLIVLGGGGTHSTVEECLAAVAKAPVHHMTQAILRLKGQWIEGRSEV
jgi:hypothetical protein